MSIDERIREGLRMTNTQLPPPETTRAVDWISSGGSAPPRRGRSLAVAAAAVLVAGTALAVGQVLASRPDAPPVQQPAPLFVGSWWSTDSDGSSQTMTVREVSAGVFEMELRDDFSGPCSGPSTDTGPGQMRGGMLFVHRIETVCQDGKTPANPGTALNFKVVGPDTIRDDNGVIWSREGSSPPSPAPSRQPGASAFVGSWTSEDADGSSQTMTIREVSAGGFEMVLRDDFTGPCSGPSTDSGTGALRRGVLLVRDIETVCADGDVARGAPSLSFAHLPGTDTLRDNIAVTWSRAE